MVHYLDIFGSLFSFISTLFYVLASELSWPFGIVATVINSALYGAAGIYGDMSLEIIYFFSMFYGWYQWRYGGKNHQPITIRHIAWRVSLSLAALTSLGVLVLYFVFLLCVYILEVMTSLNHITTYLWVQPRKCLLRV